MGNDRPLPNRRSVVKTIGTTVVGLSVAPHVTGARQGTRYEGVAYDPVTHKVLGPASGQFSRVREELTGTLDINGARINMEIERPSHENSQKGIRQTQFKQTDRTHSQRPPRMMKVISHDKSAVTGVIRDPYYKRTAFALVQRPNQTRSDVRQAVERFAPEAKLHKKGEGGASTTNQDSDRKYLTNSDCDVDNCDDSDYNSLYWIKTTSYDNETEGGYGYCFYTTADADNDDHDYNEVPSGGWNRWNVQGYYEEIPEMDGDQYDDCTRSGVCHMLFPSSTRYLVDVAYDAGWQNNNAYVDQVHPNEYHDDGDEYNFGFSVGWGFGPVSAGMSISRNHSAQTPEVHKPHRHVEWEYPMDFFPTDQEDSRGVYFNVHAGGNYREEQFKIEASFSWVIVEFNNYGRGRRTVYSEADKQIHYPTFDVVP